MAVHGVSPESIYLSHDSKFDQSLISSGSYACFYATHIGGIGNPNDKHFLIGLPGQGGPFNSHVVHWFVGRLIGDFDAEPIEVEVLGSNQVTNISPGNVVTLKSFGKTFDPDYSFHLLQRSSSDQTIIRTLRANVPGDYNYYRTTENDVVCICIQPKDSDAAFK